MALTYSKYLEVDALLALQAPQSSPAEHDETLFIIIHQTYELWFKQILHELDKVKRDFTTDDLFGAIHTFKRCRTIMKVLVEQMDILETMTPMSFRSFRDRLETASGFQSVQYREFEFLLGAKRENMLQYHGDAARARLQAKLEERSLYDYFYDFLEQRGVEIPQALRQKAIEEPNVPDTAIQQGLLRLYRDDPAVGILLELMTDFDEGLQEWRYRHVMLVQRTIGDKPGTGGSLGVEFLKKSLFKPAFPDLWLIRHDL
ncbi:MAG: tryptophan 2,3-dioxygenase [Planctomycetes bacterium]|nr:tryptophan 2,3-dioxygenase [Planctomycetota bacterium]